MLAFIAGSLSSTGLNPRFPYEQPIALRAFERDSLDDFVPFGQVSGGKEHVFLLSSKRTVLAFGSNSYGQLGLGSRESPKTPTPLKFTVVVKPRNDKDEDVGGPEVGSMKDAQVVLVSSTSFHSSCITDDGDLFTWGEGLVGKCGRKQRQVMISPTAVPMPEPVRWVSCGDQHTVAVTASGKMYSFGSGMQGRLGLGDELDRWEPTLISEVDVPFKKVSCGAAHTVALSVMGRVFTFGCGGDGRLGHGDVNNKWIPELVNDESIVEITDVCAGERHTVVRSAQGKVFSWGRGDNGRLGYKCASENRFPARVAALDGVEIVSIACGTAHTAALTANGKAYVWGCNVHGQLGLNDCEDRFVPTLSDVGEGRPVVLVACGDAYTLFMTGR